MGFTYRFRATETSTFFYSERDCSTSGICFHTAPDEIYINKNALEITNILYSYHYFILKQCEGFTAQKESKNL